MKKTLCIALMCLSALALAKGIPALILEFCRGGFARVNAGSVLFPSLVGFWAWKAFHRTFS